MSLENKSVAITAIPDECPHMIVYDDTECKPLMFAGAGARDAALKAWDQVSLNWNAHLFVRIGRNSRDDKYPTAVLTEEVTAAPAAPEGKVLVSQAALHAVISALVGPSHHIRELQATRVPAELFKDNPINILLEELNASIEAAE